MSEEGHAHHSHAKKYIWVFVGLAVLTALELGASEIKNNYFFKASSLTLLAIAKAVAVAYWYMHLEDEKAWTKFIAAIPISAAVYAAVLIAESMYR